MLEMARKEEKEAVQEKKQICLINSPVPATDVQRLGKLN